MKTRILLALAACGLAATSTRAETQDFLFLAEARPTFVRVHVYLDGKPVRDGWNSLVQHVFHGLDQNKDGVLDSKEAERIPTAGHIFSGGLGALAGVPANTPKFETIDTNQDGKITPAELASFYRMNGLAPIQFQLTTPLSPLAQAGITRNLEPPVKAVADAVFALLDADGDGKISSAELAAAPEVLARRDEDDDEIITARELAPDVKPLGAGGGGMVMMAFGVRPNAGSSHIIVSITTPGEMTPELVQAIRQRYGPKPSKPDGGWFAQLLHTARTGRLNRSQLRLDEATFARLDCNGDGLLDAAEMAGLIREPDLELAVWLGREESSPRVEMKGGTLAKRLQSVGTTVRLNLGTTRADLRSGLVESENEYSNFIQEMLSGVVKQADTNNDGVIDEEEAKANAQFGSLIKLMDRDGDGKVTAAEIDTYFAEARDLQRRAEAGCASLWLSDQSRGLFDLLDADRDGRLSQRELRGGAKLLAEFGEGKDHLTKADLPNSYQIEFRVGPADTSALNPLSAVADLYRGSGGYEAQATSSTGPIWLRKMDRNRDGDVSRREWLFSEELFRKLDTNGDGLISPEEARQAGESNRD